MNRIRSLRLFLSLLVAFQLHVQSQTTPGRPRVGPLAEGVFLLPNGWRLAPAGRELPLDSYPMSSAMSKDGKYLLVLSAGPPGSISVLDSSTMQKLSTIAAPGAWLGLAFSADGKLVYAGGGASSSVMEFGFGQGKLQPARVFTIPAEPDRPNPPFVGDVAVSPDRGLIFVADLFRDAIRVINPQSGRVIENWPTGRRPYRILFHPAGKTFFVSSWADGSVYQHDTVNGERRGAVRVAPHPTDMVWRSRQASETNEEQMRWAGRLFVAAANTNNVYAIGVTAGKEMQVIESINLSMTPRQPLGLTPSALALSSDGSKLFAACSDENAVAVVDVTDERGNVEGFIPVGWYPTSVRDLANGSLFVLNAKGNPAAQTGSASLVDKFDENNLDQYSKSVLDNSPYREGLLDRVENRPGSSPIPARPGDPSPIAHVIYIVKGSGNYAGYPDSVTPNLHKLAREFVRLDNFYPVGDSGASRESWAIAAIGTDFVERLSGRYEVPEPPNGEPASLAPAGRLWNNAAAAGVTLRSYGWRVVNAPTAAPGSPQITGVRDSVLARFTNPRYRGPDSAYKDVDRVQAFLADLRDSETSGQMPRLLLLQLGNYKSTDPASAGDNDRAIGMIVEAVSKSKFWASTAIFILQSNAPLQKDLRSPAFVISPYTRRAGVDSSMYNTLSMLRTMELLVGLRPMTQFDAAAAVMWSVFSGTPDPRPFTSEPPQ